MSWGNAKTFPTVVVASGASTSSNIPFGGRSWANYGVQVGTMSTGMQFMLQNSIDGTNFYYVYNQPINSATVACSTFSVAAGVGTTGGYVNLPQGMVLTNARFVLTGVVSGGCSFSVVGFD